PAEEQDADADQHRQQCDAESIRAVEVPIGAAHHHLIAQQVASYTSHPEAHQKAAQASRCAANVAHPMLSHQSEHITPPKPGTVSSIPDFRVHFAGHSRSVPGFAPRDEPPPTRVLNGFGGRRPATRRNPGTDTKFRRSLPETGCLSQGLPYGKRFAWSCPPQKPLSPRP